MTTKKLKNQPSDSWPKISQGTHLTVKTFEDGSTELIWDDEQLQKEVVAAIASVTSNKPKKPAVKNPKANHKAKKDSPLTAALKEDLAAIKKVTKKKSK